jgi:hypothetical protein
LIELISASTALGLMIQRKQAEGEIRKALRQGKGTYGTQISLYLHDLSRVSYTADNNSIFS